MKLNQTGALVASIALASCFVAPTVLAGDLANGKRLAELRCSPCHLVRPHQRDEVADSVAFDIVARKFGSKPDMLALSILESHPRMNISLTRREAEDLAAYLVTLGQ